MDADVVLCADPAARLTLGELFKEWIVHHAAPNTGERHSVRPWDRHVEPRLGRMRLGAIAAGPGIIARFHEELPARAGWQARRGASRWCRCATPRSCGDEVHGRGAPLGVVVAGDVCEKTVELQAGFNQSDEDSEPDAGVKTGARVALLLPNASERLWSSPAFPDT